MGYLVSYQLKALIIYFGYLVSSPTLNAVYWYLMNKILDILDQNSEQIM
jgi:hypothetical protein